MQQDIYLYSESLLMDKKVTFGLNGKCSLS